MERRELLLGSLTGLATTSLLGSDLAAAATEPVAAAPSLPGPYLDLTTARGTMLNVARLVADLNLGQQKSGWYNGYVCGVRPDEAVRDLFGFAGFGMSRLLPHESGQGYRKVLREVGIYYDLKSEEPIEEWLNPYTNERVRVVPVANDHEQFGRRIRAARQQCHVDHGRGEWRWWPTDGERLHTPRVHARSREPPRLAPRRRALLDRHTTAHPAPRAHRQRRELGILGTSHEHGVRAQRHGESTHLCELTDPAAAHGAQR